MKDREFDRDWSSALFTDFYELTMARAFVEEGMNDRAVFELHFREMPEHRGYIVAAGMEDVVDALEQWRFSEEDLAFLSGHDEFDDSFVAALREMRFTGDVHAMAEGTPVFPYEPLLRVEAPIAEAQLVETMVLNRIHFQSVLATKAARIVEAAAGRNVVDFGSRRAHGADAALQTARLTYLVGGAGTSNVLAGQRFGVPLFGTMAHSYIQSHDAETDAFEAFARLYPGTTILVDTFDTCEGVRRVIEMMKSSPDMPPIGAVRLDSGDLGALAKESRQLLDEAGFEKVKIFASSGLDEFKIESLLNDEAPIDGFGVGTKLAISADAPALDMAYKLVSYAGRGRTKLSESKSILPGAKQVFRVTRDGVIDHDILGQFDEPLEGVELLEPVMRDGRRLRPRPTLEESRRATMERLKSLPARSRRIHDPIPIDVVRSERLEEATREVRDRVRRREEEAEAT